MIRGNGTSQYKHTKPRVQSNPHDAHTQREYKQTQTHTRIHTQHHTIMTPIENTHTRHNRHTHGELNHAPTTSNARFMEQTNKTQSLTQIHSQTQQKNNDTFKTHQNHEHTIIC